LPGYNIEHAKHGTVVITHQPNCSWLRCDLWKSAFTTGRRRKTTQVENTELERALVVKEKQTKNLANGQEQSPPAQASASG
jgi:hypothetical protein